MYKKMLYKLFLVCVFIGILSCMSGCRKNEEMAVRSLSSATEKNDKESGKNTEAGKSAQDDSAGDDSAKDKSTKDKSSQSKSSNNEAADNEPKKIFVYICGAVRTPGVYEFLPGSRIASAVEAAGGLTEEASAEAVNLAQLLADGQQIYVPKEGEVNRDAYAGMQGDKTDMGSGKVNINTATVEELITLPGIGHAKAKAIVDYREKNGDFGAIDGLLSVDGIGSGVFQKLKEYVTV